MPEKEANDEQTALRNKFYDYRMACLQSEFTSTASRVVRGRVLKGFLLTSPLLNRVIGEENQRALHTAFTDLLHEPLLKNLKQHLVIEIRPDGNCSARSVIFGALISASVAIKNQANDPKKAVAMRNTLHILLERAQELKQLYLDGNPLLASQSGEFPASCNTVIALIKTILNNEISTTELLFQANKDADMLLTASSSLNLALADLSNYILYQEAKTIDLDVLYIREDAEKSEELLKAGVSYSTAERSLVCQHLHIGSQSIAVMAYENDPRQYQNMMLVNESKITNFDEGDLHSESLPDVSFTMVTACGHTNFVVDASILDQYINELTDEQNRRELGEPSEFSDPEVNLKTDGIIYNKRAEPAADILLTAVHATKRLGHLGQPGKDIIDEIAILTKGTHGFWPSWQGSQEKLAAIVLAVNRMPTSISSSAGLIDELSKHDSCLSIALKQHLGGTATARQQDAHQLERIQQHLDDTTGVEMTNIHK